MDIENKNAHERVCQICNNTYIFCKFDGDDNGICFSCKDNLNHQSEEEIKQQDKSARQKQCEADHNAFLAEIKKWQVVSLDDITSALQSIQDSNEILYIIGNGFDLMHAVPSSYTAFRDSLGEDSELRDTLEDYWLAGAEIWADFEIELARFNMDLMGSSSVVETHLDMNEAFDDDAQGSAYHQAVDMAAAPLTTVAAELPKYLRKWVKTLSVRTNDRPLQKIFKSGKVLNFNYTEFVEDLYNIPRENICYIHGCRKNANEPLVVGHPPGASDASFDLIDDQVCNKGNAVLQFSVEDAQDDVLRIAGDADESLTKNPKVNISKNSEFFDDLKSIHTIIVIGHSLACVDWDYFSEIANNLDNKEEVHWYFGCHGLRNLKRLEQLIGTAGIPRQKVSVFRTDQIKVSQIHENKSIVFEKRKRPIAYIRDHSSDGKWTVKTVGALLEIIDNKNDTTVYKAQLSKFVHAAIFILSDTYLIVVPRGAKRGMLLFRNNGGTWNLIDEVGGTGRNYSVINRRLRYIFLDNQNLTFVYNSWVAKYSLADGKLISNERIVRAWKHNYQGEDIYKRIKDKKELEASEIGHLFSIEERHLRSGVLGSTENHQ